MKSIKKAAVKKKIKASKGSEFNSDDKLKRMLKQREKLQEEERAGKPSGMYGDVKGGDYSRKDVIKKYEGRIIKNVEEGKPKKKKGKK
jgi:hypothetical protein